MNAYTRNMEKYNEALNMMAATDDEATKAAYKTVAWHALSDAMRCAPTKAKRIELFFDLLSFS